MPTPLDDRFWSKVDRSPGLGPKGTCHIWTAACTSDGYGRFWHEGRDQRAHRILWIVTYGPLADDLVLDHVECDNPPCVRLDHLAPVTNRQNVLRGDGITARQARRTHCVHGHELAGENLYVAPDGARECRICRKAQADRRRALR